MKTKIKWIMAVSAAAALVPLSVGAADLTLGLDGNPSSGQLAGATFTLTPIQPTGTGVIDPFLRIQQGQGVVSPTAGYNTDNPGNGTMQDLAGIWTHNIQLGNVGRTADGSLLFLLDANQCGSNPALTLSDFRIYVTADPAAAGYSTVNALQNALGTPAFRIGNQDTVDFPVQRNNGFDANNGSGSGDLYVTVPASFFTGLSGTWWLTLYSQFGDGNYANNDGFEEWAVSNVHQVPDASATLMLLGMGLMGVEALRRKFQV